MEERRGEAAIIFGFKRKGLVVKESDPEEFLPTDDRESRTRRMSNRHTLSNHPDVQFQRQASNKLIPAVAVLMSIIMVTVSFASAIYVMADENSSRPLQNPLLHVSEEEDALVQAMVYYATQDITGHTGDKTRAYWRQICEVVGYDSDPADGIPVTLPEEDYDSPGNPTNSEIASEWNIWLDGLYEHVELQEKLGMITSLQHSVISKTIDVSSAALDAIAAAYPAYVPTLNFLTVVVSARAGNIQISLGRTVGWMGSIDVSSLHPVARFAESGAGFLTVVSLWLDLVDSTNNLEKTVAIALSTKEDPSDVIADIAVNGWNDFVQITLSTVALSAQIVKLSLKYIKSYGQAAAQNVVAARLAFFVSICIFIMEVANLVELVTSPDPDAVLVLVQVLFLISAAAFLIASVAALYAALLVTSGSLAAVTAGGIAASWTLIGAVIAAVAFVILLIYFFFKKWEAERDMKIAMSELLTRLYNVRPFLASIDASAVRSRGESLAEMAHAFESFSTHRVNKLSTGMSFIAFRSRQLSNAYLDLANRVDPALSLVDETISMSLSSGNFKAHAEGVISTRLGVLSGVDPNPPEIKWDSFEVNATMFPEEAGNTVRLEPDPTKPEGWREEHPSFFDFDFFRKSIPVEEVELRTGIFEAKYKNDYAVRYSTSVIPIVGKNADFIDLSPFIRDPEAMLEDLAYPIDQLGAPIDPGDDGIISDDELSTYYHLKYYLDTDITTLPTDWSETINTKLDQLGGHFENIQDDIETINENTNPTEEVRFYIVAGARDSVYPKGSTATIDIGVLNYGTNAATCHLGVSFWRDGASILEIIDGATYVPSFTTVQSSHAFVFKVTKDLVDISQDEWKPGQYKIAVNCYRVPFSDEYPDNLFWEPIFVIAGPIENTYGIFKLESYADLHVYDPIQRHVWEGGRYPGALYYYDSVSDVQLINIAPLFTGTYEIHMVGTGFGQYMLTIEVLHNFVPVQAPIRYRDTIHDGEIHASTLTISLEDGNVVVSSTKPLPLARDLEPTACAGLDQVVDEGELVFFDATCSSDPDGIIISYEWDFDSDGITDAYGPYATFTWYDDAVVTVTLKITTMTIIPVTGKGGKTSYVVSFATATDTVSVTVLNVNPVTTIDASYMYVSFTLRAAGEKYHDVEFTLFEKKKGSDIWDPIRHISVTRTPGSPNIQSVTVHDVYIDMENMYRYEVTYFPFDDPVNGQIQGSTPIWIDLTFKTDLEFGESWEDSTERIHHTFNIEQSNIRDTDRWIHCELWCIDLSPYYVGHWVTFDATVSDVGTDDFWLNSEGLTWDFDDGSPYHNETVHTYRPSGVRDPYPSPYDKGRGSYPMTVQVTAYHTYEYEGDFNNVKLTSNDDDMGLSFDTLDIDAIHTKHVCPVR